MTAGFALARDLDVAAIAAEFRERRRVRIQPFLTDESARSLVDHIRSRGDWRLVVNAGDKVFEIDRPGQAAMSAAQWKKLDTLVEESAAKGFQFRFETIRVPDDEADRRARGTLLDEFALFMSSPDVRACFRRITGAADIDFADAQATSYSAGHFLTAHDDAVEGKGRRAAYVLGLTEGWSPQFGGLLQFHAQDGRAAETLIPGFNTLNLFAVPQLHSVSRVSSDAPNTRLSVTGWLRARD